MDDDSDGAFAESTSRLLRAWARGRSEAAFRELTGRYMNMVHSVALRRLGEQKDAAADVTQSVFVLLARKAEGLPENVVLGAWLHRQTVRQSLNFLRGENRRRVRETEAAAATFSSVSAMKPESDPLAWNDLAPVLDEAVASLDGKDRAILHLRYYEDQRTSEIAAALNLSPEAAQKRLERALGNLRGRLRRRLSRPVAGAGALGALGSVMSGNTVQAAPPGLSQKIAAAALRDFQNAGLFVRFGRRLSSNPLTALAGAAAGILLGWAAVRFGRISPSTLTPPDAKGAAEFSATSKRRGSPASGTAETPESLLAALERIGRLPANFRATVAFDAAMERPDAADLPTVTEKAAAGLSRQSSPSIMGKLLERWADRDPRAVMDFLVEHRKAPWASARFWTLYNQWLNFSNKDAAGWLLTQVAAGQKFGEDGYDTVASLVGQTVRDLTRDDPEAGFQFFLQLPQRMRASNVGPLADDTFSERWRNGWPKESWILLANAASEAVGRGELEPEALSRILGRWKGEQPEAVQEWQDSRPGDSRSRFLASLTGQGPLLSGSGNKPRETEAAYEQRIRQSVAQRGELPLAEALTAVASAWSGREPALVSLLQSENDGGAADQALALAVRRLRGTWSALPNRDGSAPGLSPQAATLEACESITDPAIREPLAVGLFRRWQAMDPATAENWLKTSHWPAERLTVIQQRLSLP